MTGELAVGFRHAPLQFDRALHGIDRAGEFDHHAIAHQLHDAALVLCHQRLEDALASLPQRRRRDGLILLHEPAVIDHIGGTDGGEAGAERVLPPCRKMPFGQEIPQKCINARGKILLLPTSGMGQTLPPGHLAAVPAAEDEADETA
jgi:hypothetical protein